MKILGINGSPKNNGNTMGALETMKDTFLEHGISMEIITIGNETIKGCNGCGACLKAKSGLCVQIPNDIVNEVLGKIKDVDGIVFGSPVYYSGMNGTLKCFMDRLFYAGGSTGVFKHKVGACVAAVRRTGGSETFFDMMKYLTYSQMMIPTASYWNVVHGTTPGEVFKDDEGIHTMKVLADNMAYMIKVFNDTKIEPPEARQKIYTHFIR